MMSEQKPPTVRDALLAGTRRLKQAGIDTAALDMSLLIAEAIGIDRLGVYLNQDRPMDQAERAKLRVLFDRRMKREPMAYILGRREFHGLCFEVNPAVLIPRPETEHLVEAAIEWAKERTTLAPLLIADIGTGSGAIAVAIAHAVPECRVIATDVAAEALAVAKRNAERHGVAERIEFRQGHLFEPVHGQLDAIACNPPYIAESDRASLEPDVVDYEPSSALFSGPDGLDCIRELVAKAPDHLRAGGRLWIEIGAGQYLAVQNLLEQTGAFESITFIKDYAGIERVAQATRR